MIERDSITATVALLVAVAVITPAIAVATPTAREEIDADHPLATNESARTYENTGTVSADLNVPDSRLVITEDLAECGLHEGTLSDHLTSVKSDFVCFKNREDIETTVRLFLPQGYWTPYVREKKQSLRKKTTATLQPVKDGRYQSIEFDAPAGEMVVFEIPEHTQAVYYAVERPKGRIEKLTGIDLSGKDEPWTRIDPTALSGENSTVRIRTEQPPEEVMVQYDTDPGEGESWLSVPENPNDAPTYRFQKQGVNNTVYVVSTVSDPPPVRYKTNQSSGAWLSSGWADIKQMGPRLEDLVGIEMPEIKLPDISLPW